MVKVAVGVKKGMTQIFQNTQVVPVTVVEISPNIIVDIRSKEKHGYSSIVLAYGRPVKKKFKRSFLGQLKTKKKLANLREFSIRIEQRPDIKQGDKISVENFKTGEKVAVQGISKGKGFQGVIKRYGFKRGPETHGSEHHRRVGSIGMCSFPGRVFKVPQWSVSVCLPEWAQAKEKP